jgi:hypothetical protein
MVCDAMVFNKLFLRTFRYWTCTYCTACGPAEDVGAAGGAGLGEAVATTAAATNAKHSDKIGHLALENPLPAVVFL